MYRIELFDKLSDVYPESTHLVNMPVVPRAGEFVAINGDEYRVDAVLYNPSSEEGCEIRLDVTEISDT